jgi:hypothetical protein
MTLLGSLGDSRRVDQLHASLLLKAAGLEVPHTVHHHEPHYISPFSRFKKFPPDIVICSTAKVVQVIQHLY